MKLAFLVLLVAGCSAPPFGKMPDTPYDLSAVVRDLSGVDLATSPSMKEYVDGGAGSCASPRDIEVGFSESGTTVGYPVSAAACSGAALPTVVFRFTSMPGIQYTFNVDDVDGLPLYWTLRQDGCAGSATICNQQTSGHADVSGIEFAAGTWYIVIARDPAGSYTFSLE